LYSFNINYVITLFKIPWVKAFKTKADNKEHERIKYRRKKSLQFLINPVQIQTLLAENGELNWKILVLRRMRWGGNCWESRGHSPLGTKGA
jgi:hypothetical protein